MLRGVWGSNAGSSLLRLVHRSKPFGRRASASRAMAPQRVVRRLRPGEEPAATAVLAKAFRDDPFAHFLYPDPSARERAHATLFSGLIASPPEGGFVEVSEDEGNGGIAAVAIWYPQLVPLGANDEGGPPGLSRDADRIFREIRKATPPPPFWALMFLGAAEKRSGGGSSLLRYRHAALEAAGGPGTALWTATEVNLAFYARQGYSVASRHDVPGASAWWLVRPGPGAALSSA